MSETTLEQHEELTLKNEQLSAEIAKLTAQNAELSAKLENEKNAHAKTQEDALQLNEELQKKLETSSVLAKSDLPVLEVGGKAYLVKYKTIRMPDGSVVSAEAVLADKKLAASLLEMKSGMLKLVPQKK